MTIDLTQHSPLGGSGAYRWMPCPGSVRLSYGVDDLESEWASLGTAAHALGEHCLIRKLDAWTYLDAWASSKGNMWVGKEPDHGVQVDKDMADAVQVYLDAVRGQHPDFHPDENAWVEMEFRCPDLHEYFWGKSDAGYWDELARTLHVWDYKHGAGIVVEVKENPQLMYYACGVLEYLKLWKEIDKVVLWVAQPRGFHHDGPIRSWSIGIEELMRWMEGTLLPAMDRTLTSNATASGLHCRFCPARARACPQLLKDTMEFQNMTLLMNLKEEDAARDLTNDEVARYLDLIDVVKIAGKAANYTAFVRAEAGHKIPGRKLVKARSNREWRKGEMDKIMDALGKKAMTKPELLSPSKVEKLPGGEKLVARYAFKPDKGRTLVRADDPRISVGGDTKSMFEKETQKRKGKK